MYFSEGCTRSNDNVYLLVETINSKDKRWMTLGEYLNNNCQYNILAMMDINPLQDVVSFVTSDRTKVLGGIVIGGNFGLPLDTSLVTKEAEQAVKEIETMLGERDPFGKVLEKIKQGKFAIYAFAKNREFYFIVVDKNCVDEIVK